MIPMTLAEVAEITGGRVANAAPDTLITSGVEYDSRKVGAGGLFVAFEGANVDGHDYVAAARDAGAVASIVTRPVAGPSVEVTDARAALTALAVAVVRRLPATVVGLTGSSGKTSTKDLIGALLRPLGPTVAPAGSLNNELGFPYTVLQADAETRFLVLEMGARGVGHIRYLADIAPPRIGLVLNVGTAHLGEFGSREAIARAKGELVEALPADGVAVLNADDPLVAAMAERTSARVVTFGRDAGGDVRAEDVSLDELGRPRFRLATPAGDAEVAMRLVGAHHVANALAAAAVALECGASSEAVADGLSAATAASRWRMEVTERSDGLVVINDAYNANPESMRAALDALATVTAARATGCRSVAVLGPMAELGPAGPAAHESIGRVAGGLGVSQIVAVGEQARPYLQGAALEGSWSGESRWVPDREAAIALLRDELRGGDVVLVKASRSAGLERVAQALADDSASVEGRDPIEKGNRTA